MVVADYVLGWIIAHSGVGDRGANLIEYGLLVSLIAVVCVLAVAFMGRAVSSKFSSVGSGFT